MTEKIRLNVVTNSDQELMVCLGKVEEVVLFCGEEPKEKHFVLIVSERKIKGLREIAKLFRRLNG
jgi:hypothetical protein